MDEFEKTESISSSQDSRDLDLPDVPGTQIIAEEEESVEQESAAESPPLDVASYGEADPNGIPSRIISGLKRNQSKFFP